MCSLVTFFIFDDVADSFEFSLFTTSEGVGQVEICAVLMDPGPATAPQDFVFSLTTESGTASMFINDTIRVKPLLCT